MINKNRSINNLKNKKLGVVFSSGFFDFFAHTGCLKALEVCGIKATGYAGSSSGAIVAAFAASGMNADDICNVLFNLKKEDFWDPEPWYKTGIAAIRFFKGWLGRLKGEKFKELLEQTLPVKTFEELALPCVITGTNLTEKSRHLFTTGSIADAVHASSTVPWLFKLKRIQDKFFVDGGLVDKAPVEALANFIRPEVIIVHYLSSIELQKKGNGFLLAKLTPQKTLLQSFNILRHEHYAVQKRLAEKQGIQIIELSPSVPRLHPEHLKKGKSAFEAAYNYTKKYFGFEEYSPFGSTNQDGF